MSETIGYEKEERWFCHKKEAGYQRGEDDNPRKLHDACFKCASKPYSQPIQFREEKNVTPVPSSADKSQGS